jgi:hypothetical protein
MHVSKRVVGLVALLLVAVAAAGGVRSRDVAQAQPTPKRPPPLSGYRDLVRSGQSINLEQPSGGTGQITAPLTPTGPGFNHRVNRDLSGFPQNETTVGINPTNPNNIVVGSNNYQIGIGQTGFHTSPGVRTIDFADPMGFDTTGIIPMVNVGNGEAWDGGGDPAVDFDHMGRAYMAGLFFNRTDDRNGIVVSRSDNGGRTWTRGSLVSGQNVVVYDNVPGLVHDKEYIAVDRYSTGAKRGRIYVTWTRFRFQCPVPNPGNPAGGYCEGPIWFAQSADGGVSWSTPIEISGINPAVCSFGNFFDPSRNANACNFDQYSVPTVGSDGTVYVSFYNGNTPTADSQMLMVKCPAAADCTQQASWTQPVRISSVIDSTYPVCNGRLSLSNSCFRLGQETFNIAVDRTRTPNRLYAFWEDNFNGGSNATGNGATGGTDSDVWVAWSDDGGMTWLPQNPAGQMPPSANHPIAGRRVNQDTGRNDQFMGWAAAALSRGSTDTGFAAVCAMFLDRRNDGGNKLNDVYASCSTNGGANWAEVKLNDTPPQNCSDLAGFTNAMNQSLFIGDYNAIAAGTRDGQPFFFAAWVDCRNATAAVRQSDIYGTDFFPPFSGGGGR